MICFSKKFSKSFKNKRLIAGSCAISTLFVQAPTQAIGRIIKPVLSTTSKTITGIGGDFASEIK